MKIAYGITHMWNPKDDIQINLFTKQKQTHSPRKQTYAYKRENGVDKLGV